MKSKIRLGFGNEKSGKKRDIVNASNTNGKGTENRGYD